jgi:hypothetical protein
MATEQKHTPGPWVAEVGLSTSQTIAEAEDKSGTPIYHNGFHIGTWLDNEWDGRCPNADLIAAAPDLLEALRRYVSLDSECHHGVTHCGECAYCLAEAAIAKATQS